MSGHFFLFFGLSSFFLLASFIGREAVSVGREEVSISDEALSVGKEAVSVGKESISNFRWCTCFFRR